MARVKIERIIEHLDSDMKQALARAVRKALPNAEFSQEILFREFKMAVDHEFGLWARVPDDYVEK